MSELELVKAFARNFGKRAVKETTRIPIERIKDFTLRMTVRAVKAYKQGEPWEPGEREAAIAGAISGVREQIKERLG